MVSFFSCDMKLFTVDAKVLVTQQTVVNLLRLLKVSLVENKPLLAKVNSLECRSRRQNFCSSGIKPMDNFATPVKIIQVH